MHSDVLILQQTCIHFVINLQSSSCRYILGVDQEDVRSLPAGIKGKVLVIQYHPLLRLVQRYTLPNINNQMHALLWILYMGYTNLIMGEGQDVKTLDVNPPCK